MIQKWASYLLLKIFALNINGFIPLSFTGTYTHRQNKFEFSNHGLYLFEYENKEEDICELKSN
jgi:hypothetical protein